MSRLVGGVIRMAGWAREILAKITTVNEMVTAFKDDDRCRRLLER
jgi:hypothetical protein